MTVHKSTGNGIIYKLDDDDKRRENTDRNYMMGNGHFTIYGNDPKTMDSEMARCMSIKRTIIH